MANASGDRWFSHYFKRYFISQSQASFNSARSYCENTYKGSLVEISDTDEDTVLLGIIQALPESMNSLHRAHYWIGLMDLNGTFTHAKWINSNNTVGNWNSWHENIVVTSSKLCAGVSLENSSTQLRWINLNCADNFSFICQLGDELCKAPSVLFDSTCITSFYETLIFRLSEKYCKDLGKQLVQIESYNKLQALKSLMIRRSELWIGLKANNSKPTEFQQFKWLMPDFSIYPSFTNWGQFSQPKATDPQSGNCITIDSATLLWNNRRCNSFYPFICEQNLSCPVNWLQIGGNCYYSPATNFSSWSNAFAYCISMNATLAIIRDKSEFNFVESIVLSTGKSLWVALKSNSSGLKWFGKDEYQTYPHLRAVDICMVAGVIHSTIHWRLQKCLNNRHFYPLCMQDARAQASTDILV
ncbi:uncharacterized protein TRIADDRAFT_59347 [Trichoplax adhaerens]|uniref:C-type lectin domain-containing protein n=1 Tax=Trichoplax adhaerens TaxID=10228 RepID=B3S4U2_TRIAD|nr:predicted protein [Trichoplax adhaerens]EDV22147.1 predicted protein [Trichoplax adhaerens]|eukprot:XP_002115302.1 predicted protein [Trichoplax adhaerens]